LLIIPAIDLKSGKCVRLWQGQKEKETVYAENPVEIATLWKSKGAKRLHIVDLDGAFSGKPQHLKIVEEIKEKVPVEIQYGGGIRSLEVLEEVIRKGVDFTIIGTKALSSRFIEKAVKKFGQRIIVSIDLREDKIALKGWEKEVCVDVKDLIESLAKVGIKTVILTDIKRDGTLEGVNINFIQNLVEKVKTDCNFLVAGGICSLEDIKKIKRLKSRKISGIIIGKALYTGNIKLEEALKLN